MTFPNLVRLLVLAALWGASFLFLRIAVPVLGPAAVIEARVAIAAVFLALAGLAVGSTLRWRSKWRHYLLLGALNSALPFLLLAFAAQSLTASMLAILNATTPAFGALAVAVWTRTRPAPRVLAGLVIGTLGVAMALGIDTFSIPGAWLAVAACLGATLSYGIATVYTRFAAGGDPLASAQGNMWAAALLVLPFALAFPPPALPTPAVALAVLGLGVLSTGIAYILYFRLVAEVGPTSTLTVTFLIPVFGVLWGVLFLNETVTWNLFAGAAVVLVGTALVTGVRLPAAIARLASIRS